MKSVWKPQATSSRSQSHWLLPAIVSSLQITLTSPTIASLLQRHDIAASVDPATPINFDALVIDRLFASITDGDFLVTPSEEVALNRALNQFLASESNIAPSISYKAKSLLRSLVNVVDLLLDEKLFEDDNFKTLIGQYLRLVPRPPRYASSEKIFKFEAFVTFAAVVRRAFSDKYYPMIEHASILNMRKFWDYLLQRMSSHFNMNFTMRGNRLYVGTSSSSDYCRPQSLLRLKEMEKTRALSGMMFSGAIRILQEGEMNLEDYLISFLRLDDTAAWTKSLERFSESLARIPALDVWAQSGANFSLLSCLGSSTRRLFRDRNAFKAFRSSIREADRRLAALRQDQSSSTSQWPEIVIPLPVAQLNRLIPLPVGPNILIAAEQLRQLMAHLEAISTACEDAKIKLPSLKVLGKNWSERTQHWIADMRKKRLLVESLREFFETHAQKLCRDLEDAKRYVAVLFCHHLVGSLTGLEDDVARVQNALNLLTRWNLCEVAQWHPTKGLMIDSLPAFVVMDRFALLSQRLTVDPLPYDEEIARKMRYFGRLGTRMRGRYGTMQSYCEALREIDFNKFPELGPLGGGRRGDPHAANQIFAVPQDSDFSKSDMSSDNESVHDSDYLDSRLVFSDPAESATEFSCFSELDINDESIQNL